jgi:hypothetical protein
MRDLSQLIESAAEIKPAWDEPCNHCGWCCLTGACPVGRDLGAGDMLPCKFLTMDGKVSSCSLAVDDRMIQIMIAAGTGCDAKTQNEILKEQGYG